VDTLARVLEETELGVALVPKSHTSWESEFLGHVNTPRGLPKNEVKHGAEVTKRRGAPNRLGCVNPKGYEG
jgi:hypothetical protein